MLQDISAKPFGWCTENAQKGFSLWSPVLSISLIKPSLGRLSVYVGVCLCMCAWVHNKCHPDYSQSLVLCYFIGGNVKLFRQLTDFKHFCFAHFYRIQTPACAHVYVCLRLFTFCAKSNCVNSFFFLEGLFNICVLYVSYCLITLPSVLILDPGCRCVTAVPHRFAIADYKIVRKYELLNENVNGMQMSDTSLTLCIAPQQLPKKSTRSKGRPFVK